MWRLLRTKVHPNCTSISQAALTALPYNGGGTRTNNAIEPAVNEIFSPARGDRLDASNVLMMRQIQVWGGRGVVEILQP